METLVIVGIAAVIGIISWVSAKVNRFSLENYGFAPFGSGVIMTSIAGTVAIGTGYVIGDFDFVENLRNATEDFPVTNAVALYGLGVLIHTGLFIFITIRTSFVIAIWTSVVLVPTSIFMLILFFFLAILGGEAVKKSGSISQSIGSKE